LRVPSREAFRPGVGAPAVRIRWLLSPRVTLDVLLAAAAAYLLIAFAFAMIYSLVF
jgi:hypothetical protein